MKILVSNKIIESLATEFPNATIDPAADSIVVGATTPESALFQTDYPFGFRLRCIRRSWIETKKNFGSRVVSQTSNPKRDGLVWNKPKAGTYTTGVVVLTVNSDGEMDQHYLSDYRVIFDKLGGQIADEFATKFATALTEDDLLTIKAMKMVNQVYLRRQAMRAAAQEAAENTTPQTLPETVARVENRIFV